MPSFTRRDFLRGTAAGALGASLGLAGLEVAFAAEPEKAKTTVVLVRDEAAIGDGNKPQAKVVEAMLDKAVCRLAGKDNPVAAWKTYIRPDDTVGIKTTLYMISTSAEVVAAVRAGVEKAGVADDKIQVGDRGASPGKSKPVTLCSTCRASRPTTCRALAAQSRTTSSTTQAPARCTLTRAPSSAPHGKSPPSKARRALSS